MNTPDTAISVLNLFGTNKTQIEKFAHAIASEVADGNENPLKIHALCKALEATAEAIKSKIKHHTANEASKYGENKPFEFMGMTMEYTSVRTEYDFSVCNDSFYNDLKKEEEEVSQNRKDREQFLKSIKGTMEVILGDEVITIIPPVKRQTMGVKVTIKK